MPQIRDGLFMQSQRIAWQTPAALFSDLHHEFDFTLDACAAYDIAQCPEFLTGLEGLLTSWSGHRVWCNPPYGRGLEKWLSKAALEAAHGVTTCMLLPARTDTRWWHDHAMNADEIRFIKGRLKFGGAKYNAPFPSVVLVWRASPGKETI